MAIDVGSIEMYMGPQGLGSQDDLEQVIIDFIDGARNTLEVAVQELESRPIAEAIIAERRRRVRVRVRVVLEGAYLTLTTAVADPWTPGGQNESNREIYAALLRAKVHIVSDLNPKIFH
jgi:hypothetical protein